MLTEILLRSVKKLLLQWFDSLAPRLLMEAGVSLIPGSWAAFTENGEHPVLQALAKLSVKTPFQ